LIVNIINITVKTACEFVNKWGYLRDTVKLMKGLYLDKVCGPW